MNLCRNLKLTLIISVLVIGVCALILGASRRGNTTPPPAEDKGSEAAAAGKAGLSFGLGRDGKSAEAEAKFADMVPLRSPVREVWLDLEGDLPSGFESKQAHARVMTGDGKVSWVLPVWVLRSAKLVPAPNGVKFLQVKVLDGFNDPLFSAVLEKAIPQKLAKLSAPTTWEPVDTVGHRVDVTLFANRAGGRRTVGAPVQITRSPGLKEHLLEFPLPQEFGGLAPDQFGLTFTEPYLMRYSTPDIEATVGVSQQAGLEFKNMLTSDPKGKEATVLVTVGGKGTYDTAVRQVFQRKVTMQVVVRLGIEPNPALLTSIADKLFAGVEQEKFDANKLHDDVVATFVLPNGVRATATIAVFKELVDKNRKEHSKDEKNINVSSEGRHEGSGKGIETSGQYAGAGGSLGFNVKSDTGWEKSTDTSHSLTTEDIDEIAKAITGELPAAMMNADQCQKLATCCQTAWEFSASTFWRGEAVLTGSQSLQVLQHAATVAQLLAKKAKLEDDLKKKEAELEAAVAAQNKALAEQLKKHCDNLLKSQAELRTKESYITNYVGVFGGWKHCDSVGWYKFNAVGGYENAVKGFLDGHDPGGPTLREQIAAAEARATDLKQALKDTEAAVSSLAASAGTPSADVVRLRGEVSKLRAEIQNVIDEILLIKR